MSTKQRKLAIIGFGRIVELIHLPTIQKIPEITVSGVYDITDKRRALAEKRGFDTYATIEELLHDSVDAVLIATPPNSHCELAKRAIQSGKHVLIEKPVTVNVEEAREIAHAANQYGVEVTVFHNRRFDPDYQLIKSTLQNGRLGEILFIKRLHHMSNSGVSFGVKSFDPEWRVKSEFGGGALLDWGVHLLDQLLHLKLGKVKELRSWMHRLPQAHGEVDDHVEASLALDNGTVLSMDINFRSEAKMPLWVVGGTLGTLQVHSEREATLYFKDRTTETLSLDRPSKLVAKRIYESFVQAINGTGQLDVKLEEVIDVMEIIDQIQRYEKKKQPTT